MFERHGSELDARREPIGILIGAARRRIKQTTGARLRGAGLSPQQFWVLMAVHRCAGGSLRRICERLRIDAPTASRVVSTLAAKRLVRIGGDQADRRRCRLELTLLGRHLAERLTPILEEQGAALVHGLSAVEQQTLRALLYRLIENLGSRSRRSPRSSAAAN